MSRVVYEYHGVVEDWREGPVELELDGGATLRLHDADGGESLEVESTPWEDPLQNTDQDMLEFVQQYGKWTKIDVSSIPPYHLLVGKVFEGFCALFNQFERFAGVECKIGGRVLTVYAAADECFVFVGQQRQRLQKMGFTVGPQYSS